MAMATKKVPPASAPPPRRHERAPSPTFFDRIARVIDSIYRFLASLKLAVISLATLAATLAYATFFESWYGAGASQQWIYRSAGFAILLAFLGMNILCAALIRYPWKKRQTGFVVTHAGLLIVLAGSFYSVRTADEGQVGMLEGDVKSELVRIDDSVIRIWKVDPHSYEVKLMSAVSDVREMPARGKDLMIVAAVDSILHFRVFDSDGDLVVDTDEKRLTKRTPQIEELRKQLGEMWPPHELSRAEQGWVSHVVTSIAGPAPREFDLPYRPGPFEWGPNKPRFTNLVERALSRVSFGLLGPSGSGEYTLTESDFPFQFVVKEHLPASIPAVAHVADPDGAPMARLGLGFKGPGMRTAQDGFRSAEDHWFVTDKRFYRVVRSQGPALVAFSYVDRPELIDDFLKPPAHAGAAGVARFRYPDRSGRVRVFDWDLDGQQDKSVVLPESELKVTLAETTPFPTASGHLNRVLGEDPIPIAVFKIQSGKDEPVTHMALANLPMVPNLIPRTEESSRSPARPLATIHYIVNPTLDSKSNGRLGQIEILAGPDEALYYRVHGRGKGTKAELRASGAVKKGELIPAFGGGAGMPMTISFTVDQYLPAGIEKHIYEPVVLPKSQMGNGIAACRAEMTVGDETKEVWLSRSETLDPPQPKTVNFRDSTYQLIYDVDRKPLGFELKLDDFDTGFEPGTEQATHFESKVRLTDPSTSIKDRPYTISMNHPLDHGGFTFYQSNYIRVRDPDTGEFTGQFQSVFQVATNPGRPIIYTGCILVVLGTFLQFYMRAGIFTDGGKKERERAHAKTIAKPRAATEEI